MKSIVCIIVSIISGLTILAQPNKARLEARLDSFRLAGNYPGLSMAVVSKDNTLFAITAGFNDKEKQLVMKPEDLLMQGSVGKTYVSAIALQLVKKGMLNLDDKVSKYLGGYDWYSRIPNSADITIKQIMNHSSGVMRYEFKPDFLTTLTANPSRYWKPEDLLKFILDEKPSFPAGEGWEYSDTNYILLGMIIEKITGKKYYDLLQKEILAPQKLQHTKPTDKIILQGISQGYAGAENEFGKQDKVIQEDGSFIINPQFEWTGGGIYSTTSDLARWGKLLYEGKIVDTALLLSNAVAAKLGKDTKYAMGVIIRQTPLGVAYGHSGFFPGYLTEMLYFPDKQICIALQANSSDFKNIKIGLLRILLALQRDL